MTQSCSPGKYNGFVACLYLFGILGLRGVFFPLEKSKGLVVLLHFFGRLVLGDKLYWEFI